MLRLTLPIIFTASLLAGQPHGGSVACESLAGLKLPRTTITVAQRVPAGTFAPPSAAPIAELPAFCRVAATLAPTTDSDIRIELWMPEAGWNSRFEGTGNGGFAGGISWGSLAGELRRGFAVANTDMGMRPPAGFDARAFVGHPEKWADWGYRSTHEMTVVSKLIVRAFYKTAPKHSYFSGCSTGGEQALMEAQRFPDDYDGILGGAAANNRTGVHTSILWNYVVTQRASADYLPASKLSLLASAVLAACDAADGLKDGLIGDPRQCHFDPAAIACKSEEGDACLTLAQVQTARQIYAGPVNPRTKQQIYPGVPAGSELDWKGFGPTPGKAAPPPFEAIFQWGLGADWNWRTFDFDRSYTTLVTRLGPMVNALNPDLSAFESRGHKLIVYHGWADALVTPGEAINYRDAVLADHRHKARTLSVADAQRVTDQFYRLFMIPGMAHCGGGPGLSEFRAMEALVKWVEQGIAPDSIVASGKPGGVAVQRPICPYPQVARYRGAGDEHAAASFFCADVGTLK